MKRRKKTILLLYSILLAAFSVYFLLDTFVIERVYSTEVSAVQSAQTGSAAAQILFSLIRSHCSEIYALVRSG